MALDHILVYIRHIVSTAHTTVAKWTYKAGDHQFLLELPPDLNLDLHAFCELHFQASKAEVARRAIARLISDETADPAIAQQFEAAKEKLSRLASAELRLVESRGKRVSNDKTVKEVS